MKIYEVSYSGLWMGGVAIVIAPDMDKAEAAVESDPMTQNFDNVTCTMITDIGPQPKLRTHVLYNSNGDY